VLVDLLREANLLVPKSIGHDLGVHTIADEHARVSVAQAMKAER
jgi:hypothetical protein